jgi:hypothetical protein
MTESVDIPVEYRLYYDDRGDPIVYVGGCYTEAEPGPEGKFVVIDHFQFLCRRHDVKIVNEKIIPKFTSTVMCKLVQKEGIKCAMEDISIPVSDDYTGNTIEWGMKVSERTDY